MTRLWTALFEVIRMMILLMVIVAILGEVEKRLFSSIMTWHDYDGMILLGGNVLLYFVLYRNKLQFHGWYRSAETQRKLSKKATSSYVSLGIILIMTPAILSWLG